LKIGVEGVIDDTVAKHYNSQRLSGFQRVFNPRLRLFCRHQFHEVMQLFQNQLFLQPIFHHSVYLSSNHF